MTTIEAVPATPSDVPPQSAIQQPVQPLAAASPQTYAVALRDPLQSNTAPAKPPRLVSLDVVRGMTIAAMVLVNTMPDPKWWALVHADEQGAGWNGWTPTDLIFPFFLFIVGVATPFSLGKRAAKDSRGGLLAHIWARAIALFALGELLTGLPYTSFSAIPPGYEWIKTLRFTLAGLCLLGVLLLLIPWPSKKLTLWLPPIILVLFYITAFVCHYIIQRTGGLPEHFSFGNGLLNPLHLRIPGVLQRIGICYGVAASIGLYFDWRMVLLWAIALMTIYTGIVFNVPFKPSSEVTIPFAPSNTATKVTGVLTRKDNLGRRIDEWLLIKPELDASGKPVMNDGEPVNRWNHAYGYPDNEGLLSTIPAIAEVLLGILAGVWLRTFRPAAERGMGLLVFGLFTLLAGMALDKWVMPINKLTWSPSFTVFTSGMALLTLGTVFYFVDVLGRRAWAIPFKIYGMNAIAAFCTYGLLVRLMVVIKLNPAKYHADNALGYWQHQVFHGVESFSNAMQHLSPKFAFIGWGANQSLAYSITHVLAVLVLMSLLYVCKVFVKV